MFYRFLLDTLSVITHATKKAYPSNSTKFLRPTGKVEPVQSLRNNNVVKESAGNTVLSAAMTW